jgi:SAM-dependent methyltransferase
VSYRPREFWEGLLGRQFDLRGTGDPNASSAYNDACYALRREVLTRALAGAGVDPRGRRVLDVGCGTGFFTRYYLERGALVTGLDIAQISVETLRKRHPEARFLLADVSEQPLGERYDLVNAFDVLYHITDDARWERALAHLADAVAPGGLLLLTDTFREDQPMAAHNRMRSLARYAAILGARGFRLERPRATHVLLNQNLGFYNRFNRWLAGPLLAFDRWVLQHSADPRFVTASRLLVARREGEAPRGA